MPALTEMRLRRAELLVAAAASFACAQARVWEVTPLLLVLYSDDFSRGFEWYHFYTPVLAAFLEHLM